MFRDLPILHISSPPKLISYVHSKFPSLAFRDRELKNNDNVYCSLSMFQYGAKNFTCITFNPEETLLECFRGTGGIFPMGTIPGGHGKVSYIPQLVFCFYIILNVYFIIDSNTY